TPVRLDEQRGLQGEYFPKKFRKAQPLLTRRDREIRFDFGTASPAPEIMPANEFTIRWNGSVLAPETGEDEVSLRTRNGARVWVTDGRRALIDAWVKSGNDTEYRGSVRLLAGRAYPLRLEYFKAAKDNTASISLLWKVPQQAVAVVPQRHLSPQRAPETF